MLNILNHPPKLFCYFIKKKKIVQNLHLTSTLLLLSTGGKQEELSLSKLLRQEITVDGMSNQTHIHIYNRTSV